ncbi:MAG: hypothetical protein M3P70_11510 [Actinomycetota bacterium]|nr:hypothetical protein [Actinomycetota bacterium]
MVGFEGVESKQIDVVISNDMAVRFDEDDKTFTTAEGVAADITVKSVLDKNALEDCLLNLASVPQAHPSVLTFDALKSGSFSYFAERYPTFYAFAFQGVHPHTCLDYVVDFYQRHPWIPKNRYPRGIIVNCEYLIEYRLTDAIPLLAQLQKQELFILQSSTKVFKGIHLFKC